jgi:hypothetical protein
MGLLSKAQEDALLKAGIKKDQIGIIVHNLEDGIKAKSTALVEIIVHNLVGSEEYRKKFFSNPKALIMEANPQPSP